MRSTISRINIQPPRKSPRRRCKAILLAASAISLIQARSSTAATFTWTGGGANASWTTPANWGGVAPVGDGTDVLIFDGANTLANVNNFPAATPFNGVTFASTAGAFTLSGNGISLSGDIADNSASTQIINFAISLPTTRTIDIGNGGTLVVNGASPDRASASPRPIWARSR